MTIGANETDATRLSPDDAFSVLGNDTRIEILQTLGQTDEPLSFSDLRDRVGVDDPGQFNYHLDQLKGHFIRQTDAGYQLRQPGRRVVEAVLSGAVTHEPVIERTQIDQACQLCGAPVEMRFAQERVELFCSECTGMWGRDDPAQDGYLGRLSLPPAGVRDRTPEEVFRVAWTWTNLTFMAVASDICPRCSGLLTYSVTICENHDATDGLCEGCDRRYAVKLHSRCQNCIFELNGTFPVSLAINTDLLDTMTTHGLNPIAPTDPVKVQQIYSNYEEDVLSTEPFEAQFTFTVDGVTLTLTVDDTLSVMDVTKRRGSEARC